MNRRILFLTWPLKQKHKRKFTRKSRFLLGIFLERKMEQRIRIPSRMVKSAACGTLSSHTCIHNQRLNYKKKERKPSKSGKKGKRTSSSSSPRLYFSPPQYSASRIHLLAPVLPPAKPPAENSTSNSRCLFSHMLGAAHILEISNFLACHGLGYRLLRFQNGAWG